MTALQNAQNAFARTVKTILLGNGVIAIFLSGVFQYLLDFVSILQLMVIPVLFTLKHPENVKAIQVSILKLCAFDFF